MKSAGPRIYVALPVMDELENLPGFMDCIRKQTYSPYSLHVCVNQRERWWSSSDKLELCRRNAMTLEFLEGIDDLDIAIIDRSSRGRGWTEKRSGVGRARRLLMDAISETARDEDIIVSLDADTTFGPDYFKSIVEGLPSHPKARALAVPYYHLLTGDSGKDRAILRYEIYMRYFAINLWRISSPYSFTAIGSAIALPVSSYRAIGGITPHNSGEDFYFLQKLRKYGPILTWNAEKVFPAARYSDRVGFGTGPAMIRGAKGDWKSYPIYAAAYFDAVRQTFDLYPALYDSDLPTPLDQFILDKFGAESIWKPLRENSKSASQFIRACHLKLDAFRVLQFLKWKAEQGNVADERNLFGFLAKYYPGHHDAMPFDPLVFSFSDSPVPDLELLRELLAGIEEDYQKSYCITPPFEK